MDGWMDEGVITPTLPSHFAISLPLSVPSVCVYVLSACVLPGGLRVCLSGVPWGNSLVGWMVGGSAYLFLGRTWWLRGPTLERTTHGTFLAITPLVSLFVACLSVCLSVHLVGWSD